MSTISILESKKDNVSPCMNLMNFCDRNPALHLVLLGISRLCKVLTEPQEERKMGGGWKGGEAT